ncbi:MAG: hypothetical protein Kow0075_13050 [Salibacteraceae bacterium]
MSMERDDIIEYSLHAHHSEEEGRKIRKKIYKVTALLSIVTIIEVAIGIVWGKASLDVNGWAWTSIKLIFIFLTLLKAGYIVSVFMHLGDERKSLRYTILIPYIIFIVYLLFVILTESIYAHQIRTYFGWE